MLPCSMGVGVAMVIISIIVAIYYNVIMAYCLHYMFNSMRFDPKSISLDAVPPARSVLPWSECDPAWGADSRCYVRSANTTGRALEGQVRGRPAPLATRRSAVRRQRHRRL
jgi:hypothetical protein